jgi:hypothetical protein
MTISRLIAAFVAAMAIAASHTAAAQREGGGSRFPDPGQVRADYPDDAERYIAFDILFNQLGEATRGGQARTNYQLSSAYLAGRNEVQTKYEQGRDAEAYKTFTARSGSLFSDPSFKRAVLERYALTAPAASGTAAILGGSLGSTLFPERTGDRSDDEIKAAFYEAIPIWAAGALVIVGLTWVLMRSAGDKTVKAPPRAETRGGLPQLPDSLGTVSVSGRKYDVVMTSGLVTGTSARSEQEDLVWVRTLDGGETSWTVTGGAFKTRQGHIVSTIDRPLPDGGHDVLIAFNHTTGQLELFPGAHTVHATRFLFPCFVAAVTGSIPGAVGLGVLFHRLGGLTTSSLGIALLTLWIMGAFTSTIIAAFVAVRTKVKI